MYGDSALLHSLARVQEYAAQSVRVPELRRRCPAEQREMPAMRSADAGPGTVHLNVCLTEFRAGLRWLPGFLLAAFLATAACAQARAQDSTDDNSSTGSGYSDAMTAAVIAAANDDLSPELIDYLTAMQLEPSQSAPKSALFNMIADHGMPHVLTDDQLRTVTAAPGPFTITTADRGVTLLHLDGSPGHSLDTVSDPQNEWPFPALIDFYAPAVGDPTKSILVCAVHYQTSDDESVAEHTGRLLVLLRTVLTQRSGHPPLYEGPFNVWMSRSDSASPGGEQWRNNLYFYDIGDARSSIEWIREIAHEYSHLAFPPVGGDYTAPEAWANGYIGERLLVRWLHDPGEAGETAVESVWGRTFAGYPNFETKLIDPPVESFLAIGLSRTALAERDASGMRYVIGLLLWLDETKGGHVVGDLLWNMDTPDPSVLFDPVKALGAPGAPKSAHADYRPRAD